MPWLRQLIVGAPCGVPLFLCFAAWVLYEYWARALPSSIEPVCGKCGYIVRGLPTVICPECGSNLDQVRVTTPPRYRTLEAWHKWAIFGLVVAAIASLAAAVYFHV